MARPRMRPYPQNGATTIADGTTRVFNVPGTFVNVKQANASFIIRVDDTEEWAAAGNRRFKLSEGDAFRKIEVINNSGGNLTFQLEIGFGSIESDDVTITGTVAVDDANTQAAIAALTLDVQAVDTAVQDVETSVDEATAMLQNDKLKRSNLTPLTGATYSKVSNTTSTLVTAGANANGIIIREAYIWGTVGTAYLAIGGNEILSSSSSVGVPVVIRDLRLPAGQALTAYSSGGSHYVVTWYEVL